MEKIEPGKPIDLVKLRKSILERYAKHETYDDWDLCNEIREMFRLVSTLSNGMIEISGSSLMVKLTEEQLRSLHKEITGFTSAYTKIIKEFQDIVKKPNDEMIIIETPTETVPKKKPKADPRIRRKKEPVGVV
jgi:hypothetical protein